MTNNKKNKNKNENKLPTVSILTINQIKRQDTILLTVEHINNQTYKNILEWVIVEGSKTLEECIENEKFIQQLKCNVPIVYIPGHTNGVYNNNHLGELRNISNRSSKGEICVVMDDDDWYPKTRVEHAVSMLVNSKAEIAGCSSKYLYDYGLQRLYKFKQFGPNHSTNDCFAYKRSYFEKNSYESDKDMAEEAGYTKKFSNQMVQLDAKHTIIGSSHHYNTFNKKEICIFSCLWKNPSNPSEGYMYPQTVDITEKIEDFVGKEIVDRYTSIFNKNEVSEFDISYFCGGTSIEWDPTSQSLGGSEQAVVHISTEWVKMGKKVAVYGKLTKETVYNGIHFIDWKTFPFHKEHSVVVLWRMSGINCGLPFQIKTKKLFVDVHDNNFVFRHSYLPYTNKIDRIFFKSDFHKEFYENHFKLKLEPGQFTIIPNGLRISDFSENPCIPREPFRFCYCSCYTRGLVELLQYVWPVIFHHFPQAELHTYYGMDQLEQNARQQIMMLLGQPGVMDHGRRPMNEIVREKWRSSFHLYITECQGEIDCISIRESLVTGCIPLISKSNVFEKREGLHFELERTPEGYQRIAGGICNLLTKPEFTEMCRERFRQSSTIMDWKTIAEQWTTFF
jgi:glycosyltransferase involved in cell wall biosynthesis